MPSEDNVGRLSGMTGTKTGELTKNFASSFSYASHGAVLSFKLDNNLWEHTGFNNTSPTTTAYDRLQPTAIGLGTSSTDSSVLSLGYGYGTTSNNGNVLSQTITAPGLNLTQSYTYDALNRLGTAGESSTGTVWSQTPVLVSALCWPGLVYAGRPIQEFGNNDEKVREGVMVCESALISLILAVVASAGEAGRPLALPRVVSPASVAASTTPCPVTKPFHAEPPKDPNADAFGFGPWYINADRTIWAGWDVGSWVSGGKGNKVLWIRPQGTELKVTGRRLDALAPPLKASMPCCYPTGFQASGLFFPTAGCWEVTAKTGSSELRFVTEVGTPGTSPPILRAAQSPESSQALSDREAASLVRIINTLEAEAFIKKGSYLSLEELNASPRFQDAMARLLKGETIVQLDATTGALRGYKLSIVVSTDGKRYLLALVPEPTSRCGASFFSGNSAVIYLGKALGCEGT